MRTAAIATLLTTSILALGACGGDDGEETTTGSEPSASGATGQAGQTVAADGKPEPGGPLLVIMDASGSMKKPLGGGERRIDAAKQALSDLVASLPEGQVVGLRTFGGSKQADCEDTELVAPVAPLDSDALGAAIAGLEPAGKTPIGESLRQAATDLPDEPERTIILVSDGKATCVPPDPCDVAKDLQAQGIDVLIETVGFALGGDDAARRQLTCIAEATGGSFHDVSDAEGLGETLGEVAEGPADWSGKWDTGPYGIMTLTQSGSTIEGTYTHFGGQISGTASGRKLTGTWVQPDSPPNADGTRYQGRFEFEMRDDGESWTGTWGENDSATDGGDWAGRRQE